jgi:hypothetical protein
LHDDFVCVCHDAILYHGGKIVSSTFLT